MNKSYVSAVTDPLSISIVGPVQLLKELKAYAEAEGLSVTALDLRGKVHNPENRDLSKELCDLCDQTPALQLPSSANLQAPVRSNKTGELLKGVSLTHEVVETALVSRCEWYNLLIAMSYELQQTGDSAHTFAMFGTGGKNCIPPMPFEEKQLKITKLDVMTYVDKLRIPGEGPSLESYPSDAIAVVGAACRLPGAKSIEELWDLISAGTSKAEEIPLERLDPNLISRVSQDGKEGAKRKWYGNFIEDVDAFDNAFFGISPRESTYMDPQQRLLLETAYEAMDSSGYLRFHDRDDFDNVGCFIGSTYTEYLENTSAYSPTAYTATGTIRAFQNGKISYYFGWSGPSEVIDTACSSSLVAINRACKAIQAGECPVALAGGVNVITGIHNFLDLGKAGFLSATGQCKPFDAAADGYCRADGVGLVVLKSLNKAIADGDEVLGVIPGIATNHGGLSPSITVPYSRAQTSLFKTVLDRAGFKASQVSYIEAHGTGTQVGDPIEIGSVREVFGGPQRENDIYIGSLKANLGHSEVAAGVGSLLKVLAMFRHGEIPPLAGFQNLNPKIPALEPDHIRIPSQAIPWDVSLRAALVNSYGAAGSNSALLCCEAPRKASTSYDTLDLDYPIFLSAATSESLKSYAAKLVSYIRKAPTNKDLNIGNLAYTLHERRKHHSVRWIGIERELSSLSHSLEKDTDKIFDVTSANKSVVLVFSGQSKQNIQLDQSWYSRFPRFRLHLDRCNEIMIGLGHAPIIPTLFQSEPVSDVVALQCGTFAVQYACAKSWMDAGLKIQAVVGHSFGELTAMAISDILSLEDAVKLVASRASLMRHKWGVERGTMLAIHETREVIYQIIAIVNGGNSRKGLEVACFNGPKSQVVVGSQSAIERTEQILKEDPRFQGVKHQRVNVSHGFHSIFTEVILEGLDVVAKDLTFRNPTVPLEACTQHPLEAVTSARIIQHARAPVYFSDAIARLEQRLGPCVWLEAGVDSPIIPMTKRAIGDPSRHVFLAMKTTDNMDIVAATTASLWKEGKSTSFWGFLSPEESGLKQIWLPPYQFQRTRHWLKYVDPVIEERKAIQKQAVDGDALKQVVPTKLVTPRRRDSKSWASLSFTIHTETNRFTNAVAGHAVRGQPLCPASMYMECVVMAAQMIEPGISVKAFKFQNLSFQGALGINYDRDVSLTLEGAGEYLTWNFSVQSGLKHDPKARSTTHSKGRFSVTSQVDFQLYERVISDKIQSLIVDPKAEKLMAGRAYTLFSRVVNYAPTLRGISQVTILDNHAVAEIRRPSAPISSTESTATDICDTVSLDTFIQVVGLLINSSSSCPDGEVFIATNIDNIVMQGCNFSNCDSWTVYAMSSSRSDSQVAGDMFVFTKDGKLVMTGSGVQFTRYPITKLEKLLQSMNNNSASKPTKQVLFPATKCKVEDIAKTEPDRDEYDEQQTLVATEAISNVSFKSSKPWENGALRMLGLDSLAGVELVNKLRSQLGSGISKESHPAMTALYEQFILPNSVHDELGHVVESDLPNGAVKSLPNGKSSANPAQMMRTRQRILELISENSGEYLSSIEDSASLADVGIDSLSVIELKESLEDAFGRQFGDDHLHLQSTVKEILNYVS